MNLEAYQFLIPRFWPDVVEILLVAFVIYRFLLFLVGTRAMSIVGPGAKRALAAASLKTSTGTTTTSNGVPELIRAMMLGVESK